MAMRVHFSTDDLPPRDRIKFWCDDFAQRVHSFTPGEIPDAEVFRAEAAGHAAARGFALLDIETGLERAGGRPPMSPGTRLRHSSSADSAGR
jgi:hypothetical protein